MKARTLPLFLAVAALCAAGPALADDCAGHADGSAVKLTVQNVGLRKAEGQVAVTVYPDNPRMFMAPGRKVLRQRVKAALPVTTACFWLAPGTYAIAVYHDENGDKDFNRNLVGVPVEGFGFSNDAPTHFSLPAFDRVRFSLPPDGRTLKITMRYPPPR